MSPVSKTSRKHSFKALLEKPDDGIDGAYVTIPFDVEEMYGAKGHVEVKALFDGHPYRGVLIWVQGAM